MERFTVFHSGSADKVENVGAASDRKIRPEDLTLPLVRVLLRKVTEYLISAPVGMKMGFSSAAGRRLRIVSIGTWDSPG